MVIVPIGPYFLVMSNRYVILGNHLFLLDGILGNDPETESPVVIILKVHEHFSKLSAAAFRFSNPFAYTHLPLYGFPLFG